MTLPIDSLSLPALQCPDHIHPTVAAHYLTETCFLAVRVRDEQTRTEANFTSPVGSSHVNQTEEAVSILLKALIV